MAIAPICILFGGRCEEKREEDGMVCQLGNFWNRFQNSDFFCGFPAMNRFQNFGFFSSFPQFLGDPKNSQNVDFSAVSWDFERWARPKILCGFSHDEQGKIWIFTRCPAIFWGPIKFSKCGFPRGFLGFQRMGSSYCFGTQTSLQLSWDFEVLDLPKKIVNLQTHPRFSWDFKGVDPLVKLSHWTANPGKREV